MRDRDVVEVHLGRAVDEVLLFSDYVAQID